MAAKNSSTHESVSHPTNHTDNDKVENKDDHLHDTSNTPKLSNHQTADNADLGYGIGKKDCTKTRTEHKIGDDGSNATDNHDNGNSNSNGNQTCKSPDSSIFSMSVTGDDDMAID